MGRLMLEYSRANGFGCAGNGEVILFYDLTVRNGSSGRFLPAVTG
jgi:hypothetical protein